MTAAESAAATLALALAMPGAEALELSVGRSLHIDAFELRARSKTHDYWAVTIVPDGPPQKETARRVIDVVQHAIASGEAKTRSADN